MLSANRGMSRFGKEPPAPAGGAPLDASGKSVVPAIKRLDIVTDNFFIACPACVSVFPPGRSLDCRCKIMNNILTAVKEIKMF